MQYAVIIGLLSHWLACLWRSVGALESNHDAGPVPYDDCEPGGACQPGVLASSWLRRYGFDGMALHAASLRVRLDGQLRDFGTPPPAAWAPLLEPFGELPEAGEGDLGFRQLVSKGRAAKDAEGRVRASARVPPPWICTRFGAEAWAVLQAV